MTEAATSPWSQLESSSLNGLTDIRTVVADLLANAKQAFDRGPEMAWRCIVHAAAMIEGIGRPQSAQTIHQGGLAPWQVRRVKAYIDAKLADRIVIRELSEVARLSPSHFSRAFKRSFGAAPYAFILRRRMEYAQRLMLTTDAPLCQIAVECGLSDQSHFSRLFQRTMGTSPNEWRRFCRTSNSQLAPEHRS